MKQPESASSEPNDASRSGLAPGSARTWLDLQSALAWQPETVSQQLRAGLTPEQILDEWRRQPELRYSDGADSMRGQATGDRGRAPDGSAAARHRLRLEGLGLRVVPMLDPAYPKALSALVDPPIVLLVRGQVAALSTPAVAIIGARAATRAARDTARRLAFELAAAGLTIVSGLARGIDAAAHRGALDARGRTIGVLACGPDQIYPPEHRDLAAEMAVRGAVISEMPLGVPPRRAHFPLRNRIISGLCLGVIVVEARRRSGSLITVRHALGQGRDVFVVPGSTDGPFAEGTNLLLRDGARPVCCAADVIEDLGLGGSLAASGRTPIGSPTAAGHPSAESPSLEDRILAALAEGPMSQDELIVATGATARELASAMLELELAGRVHLERDGRVHVKWR